MHAKISYESKAKKQITKALIRQYCTPLSLSLMNTLFQIKTLVSLEQP